MENMLKMGMAVLEWPLVIILPQQSKRRHAVNWWDDKVRHVWKKLESKIVRT